MDFPSTSSISSIRRYSGPFRSKTINRPSSKLNIKNAFNEIFKEETLKDELHTKMDYFYSAYNQDNNYQKCMKFDEKLNNTLDSKGSKNSNADKKFDKEANANWNCISKNILEKDKYQLRSFLRTVNQDMYLKLIKVGVRLSKMSEK
jgi:hypothetical protein